MSDEKTTKVCTVCGEEKVFADFYKSSGGLFGLESRCKVCTASAKKDHYKNNKQKIKKRNKELDTKEKRVAAAERIKKYNEDNKDMLAERRKEPKRVARRKELHKKRNANPEYKAGRAAKSKARHSNPEYQAKYKEKKRLKRQEPEYKEKQRLKKQDPEYKEKQRIKRNTPEAIAKRKSKRQEPEYKEKQRLKKQEPEYKEKQRIKRQEPKNKEKRRQLYDEKKVNPIEHLKTNIRSLIYCAFNNAGYSKQTKTHEILGCSYEEFQAHLERTCMDNYGMSIEELQKTSKTHMDHIIPMASAVTEEDVIRLNHYTNLQILTASDNLRKSDKLDFKL